MNHPEWARAVPEPDVQPEYPVDSVFEQRPIRLARRTIIDRLARRAARPYTARTLRRDVASELQAWDFLVWGPYARVPSGWPGRDEVEGVLSDLRRVRGATNRMAPDDTELIDQVGGWLEDLRGRRPHAVSIVAKVCLDRIAGVR